MFILTLTVMLVQMSFILSKRLLLIQYFGKQVIYFIIVGDEIR